MNWDEELGGEMGRRNWVEKWGEELKGNWEEELGGIGIRNW